MSTADSRLWKTYAQDFVEQTNLDMTYDAILVVSFGGPESKEEVMPFLENVLRGRNVPRERMLEVAEHYHHFGGRSPINDRNRELVAALQQVLAAEGPDLPVYWGNRNWHPLLADTLRQMTADGVRRAFAFVTSAYSSYSGCRQYREDIARAQNEIGAEEHADCLYRAQYSDLDGEYLRLCWPARGSEEPGFGPSGHHQ